VIRRKFLGRKDRAPTGRDIVLTSTLPRTSVTFQSWNHEGVSMRRIVDRPTAEPANRESGASDDDRSSA
jgi:hypothetical protein